MILFFRPLSYVDCDLALVCFSMSDRRSMRNVSDYWIPEIRHNLPIVPIALVATKADQKVQ